MTAADQTYTVTISGSGAGTITISPGTKNRVWVVQQVSVELSSAPIGSTCVLRKNGYLITPLVATGDSAAGDPPVTLTGADQLTIVWAGCTSGTIGRAYIIYDEVGR